MRVIFYSLLPYVCIAGLIVGPEWLRVIAAIGVISNTMVFLEEVSR